MTILDNYKKIKDNIKNNYPENDPVIIAVSKTFNLDYIYPLIKYGHKHFGENKVQEAVAKWSDYKRENSDIKLHMIGKLQSNKAKDAFKLFDYIHSLDNQKLALKLKNLEQNSNKRLKYFIQVNLGDEEQKSGISINELSDFQNYCKLDIGLNVIGLMCIPPQHEGTSKYFAEISKLNSHYGFNHLSMGMTSDYKEALKYKSTYLRIGSAIFGSRY
tara:strand:+ start:423 stop:1070 length:648 start_codon:yes stop_codon:yes gene_type:complete